jgi:hypothetical protein
VTADLLRSKAPSKEVLARQAFYKESASGFKESS